jgi:DNA-binding beta-propeller fold protein YncE
MNPQLFWTLPGLIDSLARANADGTGQETLLDTSVLNNPNGIALDLQNGHIYIADGGAGDQILRVNLDGSDLQVIVADAGDNPADIALDLTNGQIYWTLPGAIDQVRRANLDGSNIETVLDVRALNNPNGIALDEGNGHIYIADGGAGDRILRANLDGSDVQVIIPDAGDNPADIALDLVNGQLYWTIPGATDEVRRANLDGSGIETILDTSILENPNGIALDVTAGQLYVADGGAGDVILRANLDGSNPEVLTIDTSDNPTGLAIAIETLIFLDGSSDRNVFDISLNNTLTVENFGGVGLGSVPVAGLVDEIDTLRFVGEGLTAENLLLTQEGSDLRLSFEGVPGTGAILRDFALEDLDNLPGGIGNILFDDDETIQDSFDVFNADSTQLRIFNRNTVTFLNDLDNLVLGFNDSDDVINGQGGDDVILGLNGDDVLRGGEGDDILDGGLGSDVKTGGPGADTFRFGADLIASGGGHFDVITDFEAIDRIDFSGFLGAGGEFSLAVLGDRLIANLSTGDTVTVLGDLDTAAAQLVPLASAVAIA